MALGAGDLIQCIDFQTYLGQSILNVYYFRGTPPLGATEPLLSEMNDAFMDLVLTPILDLQNAALSHVSREWKNLTNGTDLFVDGSVVDGVNAVGSGAASPSFVSAGFILRRESLVTRNGYKRFAGLLEGQLSGNTYVGDATVISNIEVGLAADLPFGLVTIAEPIIVRRPFTPPVESYEYASIGSASFRGIGTQNTRKAGRGI